MTLSPYSVAEAIEECQNTIDSLVDEIRAAGPIAAQAETDFEREFAKERIRARMGEGSVKGRITEDMAKDIATVETEVLRFKHLAAKHNLTTLRAALSATEHKMDGYRTQAASVRVAGG